MKSNGKVAIGRLATAGVALLCLVLIVASVIPTPMAVIGGHFLSIGINQGAAASPDYPYEITSARTATSKTFALDTNKYALDCSMESIHYQENPDNPDDAWMEIDTTIVSSTKPNWDWEVTTGHWHLLISSNTTVALGKDGQWIGFRFDGVGYLDSVTKDYVVLFERGDVTPTVQGNTIRWEGIVPGVNLEYIYSADGFKENIEVTETARTWLENHPPSGYDIPNNQAYLGAYFKCDWSNAYPAEDENGDPISWDASNEFEGESIFFRHPIKDYIVSALPMGWARHDDLEPEDWVPIRERFYSQNGNHWLILGSKVVDLNQMPEGTVTFDPSEDFQVGANLDDVYERESNGVVTDDATYVIHSSGTGAVTRYWGAHRWDLSEEETKPSQGDNITVAYATLYVAAEVYDDVNGNWHFEKKASPSQFSTSTNNVTERYDNRGTTNSTSWIQDSLGIGWHNTTSLVAPLQEVIDFCSPAALVLIFRPNQDTSKMLRTHSYNYNDHSYAAKLHIEWMEGGCSPSIELSQTSWSVNGGNPVAEGSNYATGLDWCTITNHSGGTVDITIGGTDMTGGGYTWDLADDGNPGDMIYGLYAGLYGGDYTIVVKESTPYNTLKSGLADEGTQDFGLKIYIPTNFDDGNNKSGTTILTAACL